MEEGNIAKRAGHRDSASRPSCLRERAFESCWSDFLECSPFSSKEQATSRKVARPYKIGEVLKSLLKLHR
jgi:hypothetical protein